MGFTDPMSPRRSWLAIYNCVQFYPYNMGVGDLGRNRFTVEASVRLGWIRVSGPLRPFFSVAQSVHGLNIVRMIITSCPSHSPGLDMVGDDIGAVGEWLMANSAFAALFHDLAIQQLTYLGC